MRAALLAGLALVLAPLAGAPQSKIPVVGLLAASSPGQVADRLAGLREGLRDLGYSEGKNFRFEFRYADGKYERLDELASELVRMKVDVILAQAAPAAAAAKKATRTIPIVIGNAADPVGVGLVATLPRPGGNVTGMSDFNLELITKRLELLKEVVPSARRIAVFWNPDNPTNRLQIDHLRRVAPNQAVTLVSSEVRNPADIDRAFARTGPGADALLMLGDPMLQTNQKRLIDRAAQARLPGIYTDVIAIGEGGTISYGVNFVDLWRRSAAYIDKILKGAKPADLPMEQPTKFELIVNLKAAKQIGVTVPAAVLYRADRVIE